ncbi:MAG: ABC transporter ATP-binding protein [Rhodospirillales bacterium]|nr:ABC transporter ATP-binding protein [Rhodospirillales bacterium]
MSFLVVSGLEKRFGAVEVLKGIDISVPRGGFLVLVGPSGCGKSTLLNTIAGLETVTAGEILIDGARVNELHPSKRDIAMVFQSYALYPNMNVAKNMSFGMEMRGVPRAERQQVVARVASMLQIEDLLHRKPSQLSGGQRQRVAMGRALVRDPKIFLFDEPLSNLDAKLRVEMRTEIQKLHQRLGTTVVYVTHDQIEAMTLATVIAVLKDGVLQQVGSPAEIYNTPANIFVADFMGSPSMNLVPARLDRANGALVVGLERADGSTTMLPLHRPSASVEAFVDRDVILGLRPESIDDTPAADADGAHRHPLEAHVEVTQPTGADTLAMIRLGGREAVARLRAETGARAGERRRFMVDMSKAVLFDPETEERL